jgi:hypothetical protein
VEEPFERCNASRAICNEWAYKKIEEAFKEAREDLHRGTFSFGINLVNLSVMAGVQD